ncbi:MAG: S-adenosylmethionine decarboxylase proenzyme [candidate division Zixibacteria bacterium]|nr:S-adenosylmethionine decarboxylase proenzyme [candidate division Zixibacteria bacterium]
MKKLGKHLLAEFSDCDKKLLNDIEAITVILNESARQSGATIVKTVFHEYNPHGLSGVVVIAESHLSIHTWPEYGYAAVDFFTCGERVDPWKGCRYLKKALNCKSMQTRELARGIPSETDEVIPHKPLNAGLSNREVA